MEGFRTDCHTYSLYCYSYMVKYGKWEFLSLMFMVNTSSNTTERNSFLCDYTQCITCVCVMDQKSHSCRVTIIHAVSGLTEFEV